MDYSQMSNEELLQLAGKAPPPNYGAMSNEELLQLKNAGSTQDPWAQVAGMGGEGPKVLQEEHDAITWKDRLITKNLSSSPEATLKYLQKEHPDLEITADGGQIKIKRPNETQYKVLDPEGVTGIGEALKDLGDIGYDVLSGIGTGAATTAGGIAGGVAGLPTVVGAPVGALAGGAAAGAASSGAFEAARQGLGSALGLEDNIDAGQIGDATLAGAVSPLIFGTGATAANVARKGLTGDVAKSVLKAQRGLPSAATSKIVDKFAPKIGGFLSGTPESVVKDYAKYGDNVATFEANPEALIDFVDDATLKNLKKIDDASSSKYEALAKHIEKNVGDGAIDVTDAARPMFDKIKELKSTRIQSGDVKEATKNAVEAYENVWGKLRVRGSAEKGYELLPIKIKPVELKQITTSIQDVANFSNRFPFGTVKPKSSDAIERMGDAAYKNLKSSVENSAKGAGKLREELAQVMDDKSYVYKHYTPAKILQNAENFSSNKSVAKAWAERAKRFDSLYGTNTDEVRGVVAATKAFDKNKPLSLRPNIPAAALGAIGGYGLSRSAGQGEGFVTPGVTTGAVAGGLLGGPRALRALMDVSRKSGGNFILPGVGAASLGTWNMMSRKQGQENKK